MKVVAESHIPYLKGLLEPWCQVEYLPADAITPDTVRDADALLVRTRTRCDEALLDKSQVRFIGTATIGTEHIDLDYCRRAGIEVCNAPGCNAPAVAQWVLATIGYWMQANGIAGVSSLTLGVVGVGHVGSIVARWARQIGFNVILNDPPLGMNDSVADCDIITFHTPLTIDGEHPTRHMCDKTFLDSLSRCRLILNASRGAVCDNGKLLAWHGDVAIDCWENEPAVNLQLLDKAFVGTPHIAGYSVQGKQRGTAMVLDALNRHFNISAPVQMPGLPINGTSNITLQSIIDSYNPLLDTANLRSNPHLFESLRNRYTLRNEVM